ncbi:hypothetical protein [Halioglobus maricola]|uniref:hypothetical protein n=1 Tax=Halioglobus maricola TaxID=2601894 RepID=UPI0012931526|nr:hypothetical protein [Halioglobus maricola]
MKKDTLVEKTKDNSKLSRRTFLGAGKKLAYVAPALTLLSFTPPSLADIGSPPPTPG